MLIYSSKKRKDKCLHRTNYCKQHQHQPYEGGRFIQTEQDKNLGYVGQVNKQRVTNEYYKHVKKIWKSKLSAHNKHVAHNAFTIPVLVPPFGLLN